MFDLYKEEIEDLYEEIEELEEKIKRYEEAFDKIKAEIEQEITYKPIDMQDYRMGLTKALEIIDKYKAEQEGE